MLKNAIEYSEISEFLQMQHMRHNFRICDLENVIMCGKMCNMWVLAKYAITYLHITGIPNCSANCICSSTNAYMLMYRRIDKQRNVCKFCFSICITFVDSIMNVLLSVS